MERKWLKKLALLLADLIVLSFSSFFALFVRYDFVFSKIPENYFSVLYSVLPFHIVLTVLVLYAFHMYSIDLHSVGFGNVAMIMMASFLSNAVSLFLELSVGISIPKSVLLIRFFTELFLLVFIRCIYRAVKLLDAMIRSNRKDAEKVLIVGAGGACDMLLREAEINSEFKIDIKCIVDDNPSKKDNMVRGIRVEGNRFDIPRLVEKYKIDKIIFAIPTAGNKERKEILDICDGTGVSVSIVPGVYQSVNDESLVSKLRDISIEDLLGREQVVLDDTAVNEFLKDKTVLITGGGGSIGSELCRQVAVRSPKRLIILDIYENNAYEIQQELLRKYKDGLDLKVEIASVRDKEKIYELFQKYHPDVVFHAAAHKHVPLMENCPSEAIKNNIFGTYHVVKAAEKFGVKKFILISTDKAVNPTNVMGATKRFCEMIIQSRKVENTKYAVVRFGNVLGSNGSVVPLFKKQIDEGGPITITDKRIIRYFMTIPEAAQLVLQAGAMANQNQVFVLDMGDPVKILDLAEKMIRLSGKKPYTDIDIVETGLRPGEKLYEELLMKSENLIKTAHSDIYIEEQKPIDVDKIYEGLESLDQMVTGPMENENLVRKLKELVPTYHSPDEVNSHAEKLMEEEGRDTLGDIAKVCLTSLI